MNMALRERCKQFLEQAGRDAMLRQGSPVDDLMAFVLSEVGRSADDRLAETLPLVLYFGSDQDRDEFIAAVQDAKPDLVTRKMP